MPEPAISEVLMKRLTDPGPKRILSLDGGGIRGALTLGFLEKIEEILAERHQSIIPKEKFRLHHYFDLIGGTSTGAIIAGALVIGMSAAEIKAKYRELGLSIFGQKKYIEFDFFGLKKKPVRLYTHHKYDAGPLGNSLKEIFKESVLGDDSNKTGLCVVAKRFETFSTWPVSNNPNARYFTRNRFLLRDIIRASTAAPTFFQPEMIDVGQGQLGSFVDGGLSLMNNPSFQLFLMASLSGYNIGGVGVTWPRGEEKILIVSVGTGRREKRLDASRWKNPNLAKLAPQIAEQFMNDAGELTETMMQSMGKCPSNHQYRVIDRETGNLQNDLPADKKLFTYVRYNCELVKNEINKLGITEWSDDEIASLTEMDKADNVERLIQIGEKASVMIHPDNFPGVFDIKTIYDDAIQKGNHP